MFSGRIYTSTLRSIRQLAKRPLVLGRTEKIRGVRLPIRAMSSDNNVAYKLNAAGGVDYKESKGGDKARPQLPPDVRGAKDGGMTPHILQPHF